MLSAEEDPYYRKDGSVDWTRWECRPWYEYDGSIGGIIIYTEVINERKKVMESLRESEHKLSTHLQNTSVGALSWDLNFTVVEWNPAAENIFGYTKEEAMGKHATELILPENMKELVDGIFKKLLSEKGGVRSTNENITKDGERIICDWFNTTLKNVDGNVIGVASLVQDITERKKTFEALKEQKEFSEKIVQTSSAIIVGLDKNHIIRLFNKGAEKITGFKSEEVIGKNWFKIFLKPDIYDEMGKVWENAWGAELNSYINPIQAKNGDEKIISWQTTGMYDSADETKHILFSIGEDITERAQAEKKLKASETLKNTIIQSSPDCIKLLDLEGNLTYMSKGGQEKLEIKDINIYLNKCWIDFWQDKDNINAGIAVDTAVKGGIGKFRGYSPTETGKPRWWDVIITPILGSNGEVAQLLAVSRDITEQKQMEDNLRQAQKIESIGTLTGGIAHDFNNIMGIILGNAELALDDVPKWNPAHSNLEEIKTASLRAANIVRQLLSFSRKTDQKLQPMEIAIVIKDALKLLRSTIPTTIDIEQNISVTDETILADPSQINQIMMNLCINASHAMEQSGGKLTITVENALLDESSAKDYPDLKSGRHVKIMVGDTGPGIAPKIIDRIFDPYFTTKGIGKGSGMGLAIVHGIVKS